MMSNTIAAISTPIGTGGIGIVRISGEDAFKIADLVFRANNGKSIENMAGYTSVLGRIYDEDDPIDDAIAQIFRAPKSYTGENIVELSCHGGIWILRNVLRLCLENGAQPAASGEFTKRAFLNGKLDLSQAEAVMDLINAQGKLAAASAISARDGLTSTKISAIAEKLISQSAHLAAWADFPDENLEKLDKGLLAQALNDVVREIAYFIRTYDAGKILREGIPSVIIGKPNVGKSTLMNLLAGEERSIVTDIPGTTRDVIEDTVLLGDFMLRLSDTAGIRETDDPIESAGVERSKSQLEKSELIFAVFDGSGDIEDQDMLLLETIKNKRCIAVINKTDLPQKLKVSLIKSRIPYVTMISAKSGNGIKELQRTVTEILGITEIDLTAGILMNERQRICLMKAKDSLEDALYALDSEMLDAVNVCVDFAVNELLTLTGERASDRVIDEVFARFCVGK